MREIIMGIIMDRVRGGVVGETGGEVIEGMTGGMRVGEEVRVLVGIVGRMIGSEAPKMKYEPKIHAAPRYHSPTSNYVRTATDPTGSYRSYSSR